MANIKEKVAGGIVGLSMLFGGCSYEPKFLEGKVIYEGGSLPSFNKEVQTTRDPNNYTYLRNVHYFIVVETAYGNYKIDVMDDIQKPSPRLEVVIKEGSRMRFLTNPREPYGLFSNDRSGRLAARHIEVIQ